MKHEGAWCNCTLSNGTTTGWVQHYKASFVEKLPEGSDIEVDASVLLAIKHGECVLGERTATASTAAMLNDQYYTCASVLLIDEQRACR